jgi:protein-tyrosine phosphatase
LFFNKNSLKKYLKTTKNKEKIFFGQTNVYFCAMKILMVCLGNICRSPLADGLLRKKLADNNLDVMVDSAGTSAFHIGNQPDSRTQSNALEHGLDISSLRARQFERADFKSFDQIYAMDTDNLWNIQELAESEGDKEKAKLILDLLPDENVKDVPDPYFGGEKGFEKVYQLLDAATDRLIQQISQQ